MGDIGGDPSIISIKIFLFYIFFRKEVPFSQCTNLRNPWNENKEVKICRDGQELEPSVGEVLCRMFEEDYLIDLSHVSRHVRHRKRLGEYFPKRDRFEHLSAAPPQLLAIFFVVGYVVLKIEFQYIHNKCYLLTLDLNRS